MSRYEFPLPPEPNEGRPEFINEEVWERLQSESTSMREKIITETAKEVADWRAIEQSRRVTYLLKEGFSIDEIIGAYGGRQELEGQIGPDRINNLNEVKF